MVNIKLQLWDPPGERYLTLSNFYKATNGALIVFDLSNKNSFYDDKFKEIIELVRDNISGPLILIGNKADLVELKSSKIKEEDIKQLKSDYNISEFIITSAKIDKNIDFAFQKLTDLVVRYLNQEGSAIPPTIKIAMAGLNTVGKTSIIIRYVKDTFRSDIQETPGVQLYNKEIQYELEGPLELEEEKIEEVTKSPRKDRKSPPGRDKDIDIEREVEEMDLKEDLISSLDRPKPISSEQAKKKVKSEKLERKATVFYKERMNPMKLNKMAVIISTKELYEALKIEKEEITRAATGETYEIEEELPILHVEPVIPGCICVPSTGKLDATKEYDNELFLITPLEVGDILNARVDIFYKDRLIDSIPTPIKVVKTTMVKITSFLTIIIPIIGALFDQGLDSIFKVIIPFYGLIGGLEGLMTILTGAFALITAIFYYFKKPKDAKPVKSKSLPEVISSVSEE
jgi:GTPase SAR1 family protein